jgi:hypothetical protein
VPNFLVIEGGKAPGHADVLKPWEELRGTLQGPVATETRKREAEARLLQAYLDLVHAHDKRPGAANEFLCNIIKHGV